MANDSLKIGSIWGINVNLHWTFILLMLFILLLGSVSLFAVFLALFVCVFVHEAAHSRTALRNHIRVREIVLTPIGGASVIDEPDMDPRTEFNISIAGPVTSFLLGGIFGVASTMTPMGTITYTVQLLFWLNMALGVLNILPAFPLDGGRVFRSYLERRHNRFKATEITVKVSKYIAALFVILPLIYLSLIKGSLDYKIFEFFIYAIIAFILYGGAQAELQNMIVRKGTAGLTIDNAINKEFLLVKENASLRHIYGEIEGKGISVVLTRSRGELMLLDIFRRQKPGARKAADLAIRVPQLAHGTPIMDALQRIEASGRGIAVVTRNGKPVGVVTAQHLNALVTLHMMSRTTTIRKDFNS